MAFCFSLYYRTLKSNQEITIDIQSHGCDGQETEINYLEHVEIQLNMDYTKRGDLSIDVTSAMGKGYIEDIFALRIRIS